MQADNKTGSAIICEEILKNRDYQLGHSKVFLKDEQQLFLEQERDRALTKKILIIQKHIKGDKRKHFTSPSPKSTDTLGLGFTKTSLF